MSKLTIILLIIGIASSIYGIFSLGLRIFKTEVENDILKKIEEKYPIHHASH